MTSYTMQAGYGMTTKAAGVLVGNKYGIVALLPGARKVSVAGRQLALSFAEYTVMEMLVHAQGHPVSRDDISPRALGRTHQPECRNVDQLVWKLRQALACFPGGAGLIGTARGRGYYLSDGAA